MSGSPRCRHASSTSMDQRPRLGRATSVTGLSEGQVSGECDIDMEKIHLPTSPPGPEQLPAAGGGESGEAEFAGLVHSRHAPGRALRPGHAQAALLLLHAVLAGLLLAVRGLAVRVAAAVLRLQLRLHAGEGGRGLGLQSEAQEPGVEPGLGPQQPAASSPGPASLPRLEVAGEAGHRARLLNHPSTEAGLPSCGCEAEERKN